MECKTCKIQMYERKSKQSSNATKVYICPKCGAVIYEWPDGDIKEEYEPNYGCDLELNPYRTFFVCRRENRPVFGR